MQDFRLWWGLLQFPPLSLCFNLVSIVNTSLLSCLCLSTSPVSAVLDSWCWEQWPPVVLGSLPLFNHQSCLHQSLQLTFPGPDLINLIPQDGHSHTETHTHSLLSLVCVLRLKSVLDAGGRPQLNVNKYSPTFTN